MWAEGDKRWCEPASGLGEVGAGQRQQGPRSSREKTGLCVLLAKTACQGWWPVKKVEAKKKEGGEY